MSTSVSTTVDLEEELDDDWMPCEIPDCATRPNHSGSDAEWYLQDKCPMCQNSVDPVRAVCAGYAHYLMNVPKMGLCEACDYRGNLDGFVQLWKI